MIVLKKADSDLTRPSPMVEPGLQEKDPRLIESNEAGMAPKQEAKSEVPEVENESAGRNYLDESLWLIARIKYSILILLTVIFIIHSS